MITIDPLSVIFACLAALLGVLIGRKIQSIVNFVFPVDPVTVAVLVVPCIAAVWAQAAGRGSLAFLLVCLIIFYFVGYYFNGRQDYRYLAKLDTANNEIVRFNVRPWVVYTNEDGQICRQDQTWKALWIKWRWGIHHVIQANGDLDGRIETDFKPLVYPPIYGRLVFAEYVHDSYVEWTVKRSKKMVERNGQYVPKKELKVMQTVTTVILAESADLSALSLLMKLRAFNELSQKYAETAEENYRLRQAVGSQSLYAAAEFLKQQAGYDPQAIVLGSMGYSKNSEAIKTQEVGR